MASSQVQKTRVGFVKNVDLHGLDGKTDLPVGKDHALPEQRPDLKAILLGGQKFDDSEIERELDYGREIDLDVT